MTRALGRLGLSATDVAARLGVDPKTVERWYVGRIPYPRHRAALAHLTGWPERDLWPGLATHPRTDLAADEVRHAYPHRSSVPSERWQRHFARAEREICILAYSALFLAEDAEIQRTLRDKASSGLRVRIALGDPGGRHIAERGTEEGIDDLMAARVRNALALFRPLASATGVELRLHDTVLYNSIFRADDDLLVNVQVYGCPASLTPVLYLHQSGDDDMACKYVHSFEHVWASAREAT